MVLCDTSVEIQESCCSIPTRYSHRHQCSVGVWVIIDVPKLAGMPARSVEYCQDFLECPGFRCNGYMQGTRGTRDFPTFCFHMIVAWFMLFFQSGKVWETSCPSSPLICPLKLGNMELSESPTIQATADIQRTYRGHEGHVIAQLLVCRRQFLYRCCVFGGGKFGKSHVPQVP